MIEKLGAKIYDLAEARIRLRPEPDTERDPNQRNMAPGKEGQLLNLEIHKTCPCLLCRLEKDGIKPRSVGEKIVAMEQALPSDTAEPKEKEFKKHFGEKSLTELADIILRLEIGHAATRPDYCLQLFAEYRRKAGWAERTHERFLKKQIK